MAIFRRRQPSYVASPGSIPGLTAAGQVMAENLPQTSPARRWQANEPLWQFYRSIGELHSSTRYIANGLRRVRLVPAFLGDDDEPGPLWDEDGNLMTDESGAPLPGLEQGTATAARTLLRGLRSRTGGQSQMMARLGALMALPADAYLLGTDDLSTEGKVIGRSFEALSPSELRPKQTPDRDGSTWERRRMPGVQPESVPAGSLVLRIWRDDPQYSGMADSSVAAMSDVLEENVMLTREVMAEARSRLLRGWLLIPDSVQVPAAADMPPGVDAVSWMFMRAASQAITDKASAASMIPLVSRMKADDIAKTKLIEFHGPDTAASVLKRKETIERIAHGQDLPPEKVTGMAGTTFSNAFAIDEETFKMFFEPTLDEICDAITTQYLWPSLMVMRGLDPLENAVPGDLTRFVCHYDASELLVHPNREQAAEHAYGTAKNPNFGISGSSYRRNKAFPESDKPDDAEISERLRVATILNARQTIQGLVPTSADDAAGGEDDTAGVDGIDKGPAGTNGATPAAGPSTNGSVPAVTNGQAATNGHNGHNGQMLYLRLAAAGETALERAVVKVGNQLHTRVAAKRDASLSAAAGGAEPRDLACKLGAPMVTKLIGDQFLVGEFDSTARLACLWAREAGRADAEKLSVAMAALLRRKCAERLFGRDAELTVAELEEVLG